MVTFVKVGDTVDVYEDVYSQEKLEGRAIVREVGEQSDMVSAFVGVRFDDDALSDPLAHRWILPSCVKQQD